MSMIMERFDFRSFIDIIKELEDRRRFSFYGYATVGIIIFLQRIITVAEISDGFEGTDFIRWFLLTIGIPLIIILFGVIANIELVEDGGTYAGMLDALAMTISLGVGLFFVYTYSGLNFALAVAVFTIFPIIIIIAAFYSVASR